MVNNMITQKDFEEWIGVLNKAPQQTEHREWVGNADTLKLIYELVGRDYFKKYISGLNITTTKDGIEYLRSLKLDE